MRIFWVRLLSFFLLLVSLPGLLQDSTSITALPAESAGQRSEPASPPPPPASFNEVLDRVVQREHLFVAQMRHMRPLVETYLQDLKTDNSGNDSPVKDQYFLGRLDMSDGPEDT